MVHPNGSHDGIDQGRRQAMREQSVETETMLSIVYHTTVELPLSSLSNHPLNRAATGISRPHVNVLKDLIQQNGYNASNPLTVRQFGNGYQIIEGHHRRIAAEELGYHRLPCVVEDLNDIEANLRLLISNEQQGNDPLDVGINALDTIQKSNGGRGLQSDMGVRGYARRLGKSHTFVRYTMEAAEVYKTGNSVSSFNADGLTKQLAEIHAAPSWLWSSLVTLMREKSWTVETTKKAVDAVKGIADPPEWANLETITTCLMDGTLKPSDVLKFSTQVTKANAELSNRQLESQRFIEELEAHLLEERPGRLSDVTKICNAILDEQAEVIRAARELETKQIRDAEERAQRVARLQNHVSLEEWSELSEAEQYDLLHLEPSKPPSFNKQTSSAIEWAQWSWNPITGCLHECPYCYARDITQDTKTKSAFPYGFEPTLKPLHLLAPRAHEPPADAMFDVRYKNVFTGSMADIFGRWVPRDWIDAILREVYNATQWNFLFLTKFPHRMSEFEFPDNAWIGTTVDLQARVVNAEKAFAQVKAKTKWLSVEPMLEPLTFSRLDLFQWIVIGGATKQSQTDGWHPPFIWVHDLVNQARAAGVNVYAKDNLFGSKSRMGLLELPFDAPLKQEETHSPEIFHYLKRIGSDPMKTEIPDDHT
jgi:protein gp37/ParB-like chromosome segregation protein Spo0J